jgi:hypothetical protein
MHHSACGHPIAWWEECQHLTERQRCGVVCSLSSTNAHSRFYFLPWTGGGRGPCWCWALRLAASRTINPSKTLCFINYPVRYFVVVAESVLRHIDRWTDTK